jgi:hypothetical protein
VPPSATALIDSAAELLLAGAAVYATQRMLRGYLSERQAERTKDPEKSRGHLVDAKTHYALAAFQNPVVLGCLLLGSLIKAVLAIMKLIGT